MTDLTGIPAALHDTARSLPPMVTVARAAELCGCSHQTIRDRVARGELRGTRSRGGSNRVLIPRSELVAWLAARLLAVSH